MRQFAPQRAEGAAYIVRGHKVAPGVRAWVVPGSKGVKHAAEKIGLDEVFREARATRV